MFIGKNVWKILEIVDGAQLFVTLFYYQFIVTLNSVVSFDFEHDPDQDPQILLIKLRHFVKQLLLQLPSFFLDLRAILIIS
jgi:hypothetical protein